MTLEKHIEKMEEKRDQFQIPDFEEGLDWFNSRPLRFQEELRGKLAVLDFWTYCCINCIHLLPKLKKLEEKYKDKPVVFIGVHSPKFTNEKDSRRIADAIDRYEIEHPVVNDPRMKMWNKVGVRGWPTLMVVGPRGNMLLSLSGEGHVDDLDRFLETALAYYDPAVWSQAPVPYQPREGTAGGLSYPAKLAFNEEERILYISDSNHHRIVAVEVESGKKTLIGSGRKGLADGRLEEAEFNRLQGIVYDSGRLFVSDTENHALREVDLNEGVVRTLAGDGEQGTDYRGGGKGKEQRLSNPWDLALSEDKRFLYIAMAGTHQIWIHDFLTGRARNFSGTGQELNANSREHLQAAWAQPSGISRGRNVLYVADSESSAIRGIHLPEGGTTTFVGGDPIQPSNLFRYGDRDGTGEYALLQHPLGVLSLPDKERVLIADTYNHKIKLLDPISKKLETVAGTGEAGKKDGKGRDAQFSEPSGFAVDRKNQCVYIADTNNHAVRQLFLKDWTVETWM